MLRVRLDGQGLLQPKRTLAGAAYRLQSGHDSSKSRCSCPCRAETDTTKPTLTNPTASPNPIYNTETSAISVKASDDVAVVGVKVTWTGPASGIGGHGPQ